MWIVIHNTYVEDFSNNRTMWTNNYKFPHLSTTFFEYMTHFLVQMYQYKKWHENIFIPLFIYAYCIQLLLIGFRLSGGVSIPSTNNPFCG